MYRYTHSRSRVLAPAPRLPTLQLYLRPAFPALTLGPYNAIRESRLGKSEARLNIILSNISDYNSPSLATWLLPKAKFSSYHSNINYLVTLIIKIYFWITIWVKDVKRCYFSLFNIIKDFSVTMCRTFNLEPL